MNALIGDVNNTHVATFGDSLITDTGDWVAILKDSPGDVSVLTLYEILHEPTSFNPQQLNMNGFCVLIRSRSFLQSTAGQFDACNDFVTGLHWQILFANVGDLVNPQAKIIGAKYTFTKQTLRFQVSSFAFCYLVFVLVSSLSNAGVFYSVLECIVSLVTAISLNQSRSPPR